jgi:hypothetical protein
MVGCASSSGEAPAPESHPTLPDGDKYVVDLTDDEALALCQWESERLHYGNCLDDAIVLSRSVSCAESLAACTAPDAVASVLLECVAGTRDEARSCDTTVAERLKCDLDLKQQYDAMPSCDQVTDQVIREVLYRMSPTSCSVLRCP